MATFVKAKKSWTGFALTVGLAIAVIEVPSRICASSSEPTISLVSCKTIAPHADRRNTVPTTELTVAITPPADAGGSLISTRLSIQQFGFVREFHHHKLITDRRGVAACNFYYGTKTNTACIIVADQNMTHVFYDFSERVASLCKQHHKRVNPWYFVIDAVKGNVVSVWSTTFLPGIDFHLSIRVLPSGELKLLKYAEVPNV